MDAVFTVTVTDADEGAQLTLGLSEGTATLLSDYNLNLFEYDNGSGWQTLDGPITLTAGTNTLLVRTDTVKDNVDEPDETFFLNGEIVYTNSASGSGTEGSSIPPPSPYP